MKTKLLIIGLIWITYSCQAQFVPLPPGTVPIEDYDSFINSHDRIPDGTYFKDVNNVFDKYIGTWIGTYNNKTYEILITKELAVPGAARNSLKYDEIRMRYKITDNTGSVIENTLNLPDSEALSGLLFDKNNNQIYNIIYAGQDDDNVDCGDHGTIKLGINGNGTEMDLYIVPGETIYSDEECPNGYIKPPFPDEDEPPMTLTKQ